MKSSVLSCLLLLASGAPAQEVVRLMRTHDVKDIPKYDPGFSYRNRDCAFWNEETFLCVRPIKRGGELQFCSIRKNEVTRTPIPQPAAFEPRVDWRHYFEMPNISPNPRGDLFFLWTLGGNGEHGLALFSQASKKFVSGISHRPLETFSKAVGDADGSWYLVRWQRDLSVYRIQVDKEFDLDLLASHEGIGFHRYGVVDAGFGAKGLLHCIYAQVEINADSDWRTRLRAVDFNIVKKSWSERRTLLDLKKGVSAAHPRVVLVEGKPHYFWTIEEWRDETPDVGLYYLPDGKKEPVRLSNSVQFQVLTLGKKIVVCYSVKRKVDEVFFRVIEAGKVGPESSVKISNRLDYSLWGEDMVLGSAGKDRLWFVNTDQINAFYELKIDRP
jgi:hypothetical protein